MVFIGYPYMRSRGLDADPQWKSNKWEKPLCDSLYILRQDKKIFQYFIGMHSGAYEISLSITQSYF